MYTDDEKGNEIQKSKLNKITPVQLQQMIIHLRSELSLYKSKVNEYEVDYSKKKIRKLIKHNEEMINEQRTFQDLINRKEHERKNAETKVQKLEEEIKKYKAELQYFKETKTNDVNKKNDIKTLGDKNKLLQSEIASLQKKVKDYESAQKQNAKNIEIKSHDGFQKMADGLTEVKSLLAPVNKKITNLDVQSINLEIEKLVETVMFYFHEQNIFKNEIQELKGTIHSLNEKEMNYKNEMNQLTKTIDLLYDQEKQYKVEMNHLEKALSDKEEHHKKDIKKYKKEIDNYISKISHLSEQESQFKVDIANLEQMISDLKEKESYHQQE
ncbi:hypothetical protein, partial [Peribacillus frigoritolerans]|nr:hypothetical protein [Peribacillus frigoritolerans]